MAPTRYALLPTVAFLAFLACLVDPAIARRRAQEHGMSPYEVRQVDCRQECWDVLNVSGSDNTVFLSCVMKCINYPCFRAVFEDMLLPGDLIGARPGQEIFMKQIDKRIAQMEPCFNNQLAEAAKREREAAALEEERAV
mmetsp:Transcript_52502/g.132058  ORF Transcript_52502/g.132058 Transcript_52502/m.132058 type:complete len:139 (+) Transcript_52502:39-455(+)